LLVLATSCSSSRAAGYPPFSGAETESWLAYEVAFPEHVPSDLLLSFKASASSLGCKTEQACDWSHAIPNSTYALTAENRYCHGVVASCDDAGVALVVLDDARVSVGCTKPTTRQRCDALLHRISTAR